MGTRAARVDGDSLALLPFPDVGSLLRFGDPDSVAEERVPLAGANLGPPVPAPSKVLCLGLNYRSHIEEMGRELPSHPTFFGKFASALCGPRDPIPLPPESSRVDWEVELAIVIGRGGRRIPRSDAASAVAGLCVLNDVSMRDWQNRTIQFLQGKTWERSTPLGPAVVTLDETGGLDVDLALSCSVDGEVMQSGRTSDLLFPPSEVVAYASTFVTLEPGDIIATGTPAGVGAGRTPPVFLRPGQTVRCEIEGLGELVNVCVPEAV
jgi:acylpyruvate hydrolase